MTWVHVFTRDLRIVDNRALQALKDQSILPVFVFTPEQTTDNDFFSSASFQFMCESLVDLQKAIASQGGKLYVFRGRTVDVLKKLGKSVSGVSIVHDYTPYARKRSQAIADYCKEHTITFQELDDIYLHAPDTIKNKAGKPFQKFTPFYETARRKAIDLPAQPVKFSWARTTARTVAIPKQTRELFAKGGRSEALKILRNYDDASYERTHDYLKHATTGLSAHNHYGTVSIREVYAAFKSPALRRQLFWRDFYGQIVANFEQLYGESPYDFMKTPGKGWSTDRTQFNAWASGRTGIDIVDRSMKQLLSQGYMHNRARLIVSSYLVKDLKIHWRWGERHFARHLVDYDFSQNFGNWCWVSSVLPFSMPPFRRFDPEIQEKKYG